MSLDLAAIVRQLQEVEARHPDTAADLDPIIRALSSPEESMIGTEQARKLLGVRSVNTVKRWIELGILAGTWDERSGRWRIPLAEVLRLRGTQQALGVWVCGRATLPAPSPTPAAAVHRTGPYIEVYPNHKLTES